MQKKKPRKPTHPNLKFDLMHGTRNGTAKKQSGYAKLKIKKPN